MENQLSEFTKLIASLSKFFSIQKQNLLDHFGLLAYWEVFVPLSWENFVEFCLIFSAESDLLPVSNTFLIIDLIWWLLMSKLEIPFILSFLK